MIDLEGTFTPCAASLWVRGGNRADQGYAVGKVVYHATIETAIGIILSAAVT